MALMDKITLTVQVEKADGTVVAKSQTVAYASSKDRSALALSLGVNTAFDLEAQLRFEDIFATMPQPPDFAIQSKQIRSPQNHQDLINAMNADGMWMEIHNSFTAAVFELALAKAYKNSEPPGTAKEYFYCHDQKVARLNRAIFFLYKIQDLIVRLMYESLGDSLIAVDQSKKLWEKDLTMEALKDGFKRLRKNGVLSQVDHDAIAKPIHTLRGLAAWHTVEDYRHRAVHRIMPSVDHQELSPIFQNRIGKPVTHPLTGKPGRVYSIRVQHLKPDFTFDEIYKPALAYLKGARAALLKLKALPQFA
jgi:hypothetical protein